MNFSGSARHPNIIKYVRFSWRGFLYQHTVIVFGMCIAARVLSCKETSYKTSLQEQKCLLRLYLKCIGVWAAFITDRELAKRSVDCGKWGKKSLLILLSLESLFFSGFPYKWEKYVYMCVCVHIYKDPSTKFLLCQEQGKLILHRFKKKLKKKKINLDLLCFDN